MAPAPQTSMGGGFFGSARNAPPAPPAPTDGSAGSQAVVAAPAPPEAIPPTPARPLSAWDVIPEVMGGKSVADATAAAQQARAPSPAPAFAPPPSRPVGGGFGEMLAGMLTNGWSDYERNAAYSRTLANYSNQRAYEIGQQIKDPQEQALYYANPGAWAAVKQSQQEDKVLKPGDTRESPGGGFLHGEHHWL